MIGRRHVPVVCPTCQQIRNVLPGNLVRMQTLDCKACMLTRRNKSRATHGLEGHPLYRVWSNVKRRLDNPVGKSRTYAGLDMDPAWRASVTAFIDWAVAVGWTPGLSLERRNNAVGYWPSNCCWILPAHQARNRSTSSVTSAIAAEINARVAAGENRYRVAREVATTHNIPLSTISKVAYGYNWVDA